MVLFPSIVEQLQPGEQILLADSSLRLHTIFTSFPFRTKGFARSLERREAALGPATLTSESLLLLCRLLEPHLSDLSTHLLWHGATLSAFETQMVLPAGTVVLKSVTLQMGNDLVLCSGIGDFHLQRDHLRTLARDLFLPHNVLKHCTINPKHIDPQQTYGMVEGMVSPFISRSHSTTLAAIGWMQEEATAASEHTSIAISLSRFESLLIPRRIFLTVLQHYAGTTYPQLRLINL